MKILRTAIVVYLGLFSAACQAEDGKPVSLQYIETSIQRLEAAIVECDSIASARVMPDSEVLDLLRQYEYEDVRVFLITRSAAMAEECQKPHLTDLAYTIGMLEASTAHTEVEDLIAGVKPLMYGKETWGLKEKYFQLPESMREELESIPYFQKPFRNIPIIEQLEPANRP
ncbi:hypothetical protein [Marinobacter shengliensis]|uniref:hypothetical protein n=1 Tax=Marinobacter shengliensis TaxID=1389223 RepID=UPI001E59D7E7|nr:hypothetical protein [Marinobacter shengliensis]MCD1632125.1 hypothetical protein [Marinobacter shengliensis]